MDDATSIPFESGVVADATKPSVSPLYALLLNDDDIWPTSKQRQTAAPERR